MKSNLSELASEWAATRRTIALIHSLFVPLFKALYGGAPGLKATELRLRTLRDRQLELHSRLRKLNWAISPAMFESETE